MRDDRVVLVVDDDRAILESIADVLSDEGVHPVLAGDGLEALDWLRANPAPRLILLDWMMPRCDGGAFRAQQLADPRLAVIPVVLITADPRACTRMPDVKCLRKPITLDQLLEVVHKHCA